LVTAHRRENIGEPLTRIVGAVKELAQRFPLHQFVLPVHKNPAVESTVRGALSGLANVHLLPPLDYPDLVWCMDRCELIMSDSGGIQEEAPSLRKPVLVLRNETERPEAVEFGTSILVGSDHAKIVGTATDFLEGRRKLTLAAAARPPFGDGTAAPQIAEILARDL
jgi:UDP-N-acetylglucosamine 2-epimerase